MKEKKSLNISLSTFLLIIAIIVIIIMGILMCKFYNDKTKEIKKNANLQNDINRLNGTVSELQGKINSVSEILTNEDNKDTQSNNETFSDEQVKETLSKYLELESSANCDSVLEYLTNNDKLNYDSSKNKMTNENGPFITNVKFEDYKTAMLNYVTENEFEKNWTTKLYYEEDSNGYLTKLEGGGSCPVYTIKSITKTGDMNFTAKTTYIIDESEPTPNYDKTFTFVVKSNNGKCVIDTIN